jgi:hypothetical protein
LDRMPKVAIAVIFVGFVLLPAYRASGGARSEGHENEAVAYRGATSCGIERWAVKTGMDSDARQVNQTAVHKTSIFHLRSLAAPGFLPARSRIKPVGVWRPRTLSWTPCSALDLGSHT